MHVTDERFFELTEGVANLRNLLLILEEATDPNKGPVTETPTPKSLMRAAGCHVLAELVSAKCLEVDSVLDRIEHEDMEARQFARAAQGVK